jgi:hypothetical protein
MNYPSNKKASLPVKFLKVILVAFFLTLLYSCDEGDTVVVTEDVQNVIPNADLAFALFPETELPFILVSPGEKLFAATMDTDLNGEIDGAYFQSGTDDILIKSDETSKLPQLLVASTGERLFFYFNEDLTSVTLRYLGDEDSPEVTENIIINPDDYIFETQLGDKAAQVANKLDPKESIQLAATMLGFLASSMGCIISASSIPFTFGLSSAPTILTCSSAVAGLAGTVVAVANSQGAQIETGALNFVSNGFLLSDTVFCGLGVDRGACVTAALGLTDLLFSVRAKEADDAINEPKTGWYKGTYTIGRHYRHGDCTIQTFLGRTENFYIYIGDVTSPNNIVVYIKSLVPDIPNIYMLPEDWRDTNGVINIFRFIWEYKEEDAEGNRIVYKRIFLGDFNRDSKNTLALSIGTDIFGLTPEHTGEFLASIRPPLNPTPDTGYCGEGPNGERNYRYGLYEVQTNYLGPNPPEELTTVQTERISSLLGQSKDSFILEE